MRPNVIVSQSPGLDRDRGRWPLCPLHLPPRPSPCLLTRCARRIRIIPLCRASLSILRRLSPPQPVVQAKTDQRRQPAASAPGGGGGRGSGQPIPAGQEAEEDAGCSIPATSPAPACTGGRHHFRRLVDAQDVFNELPARYVERRPCNFSN
ncbi:hypothetical protein GQ55_8G068700 [Panicum hallii var. hallii]|uniref:Uncharacterized protein n=1 Tax=Panicum hallii var. hallii TaxID=1504633 RepID=A0A2T7CLP5_9POAL|nr:hypothetical protein GQ55_8G068700 [Panicum hallii var. hallii]